MWRAKNADTFKPTGPRIETEVDLDALESVVHVNNQVTTRFRRTICRSVSRALRSGDDLLFRPLSWRREWGTDGHSPNLKAGDIVGIEIAGLGILRNPFVEENTG